MTPRRSGISAAALSASLAAAVLAGCADDKDVPSKSPEPTVRVERVIDGDTVVLTRFGKTRLIGVDTPGQGRCGESAPRQHRSRDEGGNEQRRDHDQGGAATPSKEDDRYHGRDQGGRPDDGLVEKESCSPAAEGRVRVDIRSRAKLPRLPSGRHVDRGGRRGG